MGIEKATRIPKDLYETGKFDISGETGVKKVILKDIFSIDNGSIEVNDNII